MSSISYKTKKVRDMKAEEKYKPSTSHGGSYLPREAYKEGYSDGFLDCKEEIRRESMEFEKLWQHQQGALFLKDENPTKEWKKSLAEYFYREGLKQGRSEKT